MDSSNSSLLREDHLASISRRNKTLITILFSVIISLALIIGGIIVSLVIKCNLNSQSGYPNPAVKEFCSLAESELNCIASLSSAIKTTGYTDPNRVYQLSLESAVQKLSDIDSILSRSRIDSAFGNCWSSLRVAARGLDSNLVVMRVNPDIKTQTFEQRRSMELQIKNALEALRSCGQVLEKIRAVEEGSGSTVADESGARVHEIEELLRNSGYFLPNYEWVNGNFQEAIADDWSKTRILENVADVSLFGLQYFVLIFLFCLLLRKHQHMVFIVIISKEISSQT